ncbi:MULTISPECIES: universal stress protein [unclassified Geodermatophilus]
MTSTGTAVAVAVWILTGALTGWRMARHGHDPAWLLVTLGLGPLAVPIALEVLARDRRRDDARPPRSGRPGRAGGPVVLVGVDGSPESTAAVDAASRLVPAGGRLLLAEVLPHEALSRPAGDQVTAAGRRLLAAASRVTGAPVEVEVLAGVPPEALRRLARRRAVDVLVVGARGRDLSTRLLGSVTDALVRDAPAPVLVVPRSDRPGDRPGDRPDADRSTAAEVRVVGSGPRPG